MDISQRKDFSILIEKSTIYLLELISEEIRSDRAENVVDDREYLNYRDHLKTLRKHLFPSPNKQENFPFQSFSETNDRFERLQPKKKLFCRYESYYLVKKGFTEGVQYVKPGEIHSYKTIGRPLDIYISNIPLELNTFRSSYDRYTKAERISPGKEKIIQSNTYYIIIAPCHTFFMKEIKNTPENENSNEIFPSLAIDSDRQVTSVTEDRNDPSGERTNRLDRTSTSPRPSGSRINGHGDSRRSAEFGPFIEPEMVNENVSTGTRRSSIENDRQSKRAKTSPTEPRASTSQMQGVLVPQSPNSLRNEVAQMSNNQTINGTRNNNDGRAVFAIRKDSNIESYALRFDSTLQIIDNIIVGSFAIENEDMDPYVIEYHGEVQFIRERSLFKNKSVVETTLAVQKDLLKDMRDPTKKKEKVVVNYFFECAFKTIEAAYKKFSEMRNTKMIGSCVPAIVPLSDSSFFGTVSDAYEAKP